MPSGSLRTEKQIRTLSPYKVFSLLCKGSSVQRHVEDEAEIPWLQNRTAPEVKVNFQVILFRKILIFSPSLDSSWIHRVHYEPFEISSFEAWEGKLQFQVGTFLNFFLFRKH